MEWHSTVFLGRYFARDNDYGEHWFDNWDEREALGARAAAMGIECEDLMIVLPFRFAEGQDGLSREENYKKDKIDGPCHPPALRKQFWTDVLISLELSYEFLFAQALYGASQLEELQKFLDTQPTTTRTISGNGRTVTLSNKPDHRYPTVAQIEAEIARIRNEIATEMKVSSESVKSPASADS